MKRLSLFLFAAFALFAGGHYIEAQVINQTVAVCAVNSPNNCIRPVSDGSIYTIANGGSVTASASASSTAPTYTAGTQPLSQDLNGNLRVTGNFNANTTATASSTAPTYTAGAQPLSQDLNGNLRVTGAFSATTQATASASAPTYTAGAQPISQDLSGNLRTTLTTALPTGSNVIGLANAQANATTAAPSYTTGTQNPLSQDLSGNLRTTVTTALPTGANTIGAVTISGTPNVAVTSIAAGSNIVGKIGIDQTTPGTTNGVQVNAALPTGANVIGFANAQANATTASPSYTNGTQNPLSVDLNGNLRARLPLYEDGNGSIHVLVTYDYMSSNFNLIAAATTNSTLIKGSSTNLTELTAYNNSATIAYLKLYNKATAPTCGTDTPVAEYLIPASTSGAGSNVVIPLSKYFSTGLGICITGGIAYTDTTAVAASTYIVNMTYK